MLKKWILINAQNLMNLKLKKTKLKTNTNNKNLMNLMDFFDELNFEMTDVSNENVKLVI